MTVDLMPWIVALSVVTLIVAVLAAYRKMLARQESLDLHIGSMSSEEATQVSALNRRVGRVEFLGKSATVLSVLLAVLVLGLWIYNQVVRSHMP